MAALALLLVGCDVAAGIDKGVARSPLDCDTDTYCKTLETACRTSMGCLEYRCAFEDAPLGTRLVEQVVGDCVEQACDGEGGVIAVPVAEDALDDENACTKDFCAGTTVEHQPLDSAPCYSGPPGTNGKGICTAGTRACENGKPTGSCVGEVVPRAEGEACDGQIRDEDCDGQINEEGEGCVCVPGAIEACYTGDPTTKGVGACKAGKRGCAEDGRGYGACAGEVTPMAETCDPEGHDEDCDGQINEDGEGCVCGDGFHSVGEACDDGNLDSTDACTSACALPLCGDGFAQPGSGEQCDDENADNTDACTDACKLAACGDGFVQPVAGEQCDDGDATDDGPCLASCKPTVVRLFAGNFRTCAAFRDGRVKCWGFNGTTPLDGPLGLGDMQSRGDEPGEMGSALPVVELGAGNEAVSIAMGSALSAGHTCALLAGGRVKCWGMNGTGQLGLGDMQSRGDEPGEMGDALPEVDFGIGATAIAVAAGSQHTCAVLEGGALKCWGNNESGQLGAGDVLSRGDAPGEMGAALPVVNLGAGKKVVAVTAGMGHTCVVLDDGHVKCWGNNWTGQLGLGDTQGRGDEPGEMGDALPEVDLGTGAKAISVTAGEYHTCALLDDGRVKCWGYNLEGQLGIGIGYILAFGNGPGQMGDALPAVDLGTGEKAIALDAGRHHNCALLESRRVKCWGFNGSGQLGIGHSDSIGYLSETMGENLPEVDLGAKRTVAALSVGAMHTCALFEDGNLKCWGAGGALGLGDLDERGSNPRHMGDSLPLVIPW
ncbi:RCC1 domain-containing protein [Polyangium sorediatum]|uniref:RCC1-like domain-containing protein n=1 Tax=Polyangium sorediatum TaxID=889274 RepID=A0ABT6PAA7_9BACT|nr:hypothetical protein [Polyangium sorediatum]MDI1437454.1 hypothetical protein [Polyangium sorediatum]